MEGLDEDGGLSSTISFVSSMLEELSDVTDVFVILGLILVAVVLLKF